MHSIFKYCTKFTLIILMSMLCLSTYAQNRNFDDVEIKALKLSDGVYMLMGAGGNLGLSVGEDGTFLIDDQFAPLSKKIMARSVLKKIL